VKCNISSSITFSNGTVSASSLRSAVSISTCVGSSCLTTSTSITTSSAGSSLLNIVKLATIRDIINPQAAIFLFLPVHFVLFLCLLIK